MPDAAVIAAHRTALPYDANGTTVTCVDDVIYLNCQPLAPWAALEVSAALARAAHALGEQRAGGNPNHTAPKEANHA
ncbi:hypothetical protein [Micromonospora sp. NPDC050695]|uniref:hypothetical protein n=1 Tax=Micromonospora sp. NPDC050695 TaxID=3154938 RepID=UPI0033E9D32A